MSKTILNKIEKYSKSIGFEVGANLALDKATAGLLVAPIPGARPLYALANVGGSGIIVPISDSPGASGNYAHNGTGSEHTATQHDWYLAISASPDSIGSKTQYGLYVELEYL